MSNNDRDHQHCSGVGGVFQTLDELQFARGPWNPAMYGDVPAMKKYLQNGGEPNLADPYGYTPLHYAARSGQLTICQDLISAGARVNNTTRSGKSTPLHRAASKGWSDVIKLLLENNADPKAVDDDGRTPLHKAAEGRHAEACKLLVEAAPETKKVFDKKAKYPRDYVECTDDHKEAYKVLWWS